MNKIMKITPNEKTDNFYTPLFISVLHNQERKCFLNNLQMFITFLFITNMQIYDLPDYLVKVLHFWHEQRWNFPCWTTLQGMRSLVAQFFSECALIFHYYNRTFSGYQRQPNLVQTMSSALRQFLCLKDSPFYPLCAVMHLLDLDLDYCHYLDH